MAIYRNVQMSFWTDRKIEEEFSADEKYLYLFLLTNPITNLSGCYEIGRKQIANMTGLDIKKVKTLLKKLQDDQRVIAYSEKTNELLILNWHKYNWTDSEKFRKPLLAEITSVKDDAFREILMGYYNGTDTVSIPYPYGMDTTVTVTVTDTDTVSDTDTDSVQESKSNTNKGRYAEDPELDQAIRDFIEHRNKLKRPMTDHAVDLLIGKLNKITLDPVEQIALINTAIEHGWQTVYEPKEQSRSGTPPDKYALIDAWAKEAT